MGIPPFTAQTGRRIEADGQVWIVCRICERRIIKVGYGLGGHRFSTATCYQCDRGLGAGKTPDQLIYERLQEEIRQADQVREDLGPGMFKALGIKKRVTEMVQEIKKHVVARRRKITQD